MNSQSQWSQSEDEDIVIKCAKRYLFWIDEMQKYTREEYPDTNAFIMSSFDEFIRELVAENLHDDVVAEATMMNFSGEV